MRTVRAGSLACALAAIAAAGTAPACRPAPAPLRPPGVLDARACDVVVGLPAGVEAARTTRPYYRSTYVFLAQQARQLDVRSFDDPRLRTLRIGIPLVSDDGANAPPAHALARRGLAGRLVGYRVIGEAASGNPHAALVDAVARGDVDIAAVWGPVAGYFAAREAVPLRLSAVEPQVDAPALPLTFEIAMATRRGDAAAHAMLEAFLTRRRADIDRILAGFHVPRLDTAPPEAAWR